jgi:hypothetical protein
MPTYQAKRPISLAGQTVKAGATFEADEQAVRVALARGWVEPAGAEPKAKRGKR